MKIAYVVIAETLLLCAFAGCSKGNKEVSGKYYKEGSQDEYIELRSDGTFVTMEKSRYSGPIGLHGRYTVNGNELVLEMQTLGLAIRGRLEGETIIDPEGERWSRRLKEPQNKGIHQEQTKVAPQDTSKIVGQYVAENGDHLEIRNDGTFSLRAKLAGSDNPVQLQGRWQIAGDEVIFHFPLGVQRSAKMQGQDFVDSEGKKWRKITVGALLEEIARKRRSLPPVPDYLPGTTPGVLGGIADAWTELFGQKGVSDYDKWWSAAVNYRTLAETNLIRAEPFARDGNITQAERFMQESERSLKLFGLSNDAAFASYQYAQEKARVAGKAVYELSRVAFVFTSGAAGLGPEASVLADHLYTAIDFVVNSSECGLSEAAKQTVIDVVAEQVGKEVLRQVTGGSINTVKGADINGRVSDLLRKIGQDSGFSKRIVSAIARRTAEEVSSDMIARVLSEVLGAVAPGEHGGESNDKGPAPQGNAPVLRPKAAPAAPAIGPVKGHDTAPQKSGKEDLEQNDLEAAPNKYDVGLNGATVAAQEKVPVGKAVPVSPESATPVTAPEAVLQNSSESVSSSPWSGELKVPWFAQTNRFGSASACAKMCVKYFLNDTFSPRLSKSVPDNASVDQIAGGLPKLSYNGVTGFSFRTDEAHWLEFLRKSIQNDRPVIVLIPDAGKLPWSEGKYQGRHYVVVLGINEDQSIICKDPLDGEENQVASRSDFEKAWGSAYAGVKAWQAVVAKRAMPASSAAPGQ